MIDINEKALEDAARVLFHARGYAHEYMAKADARAAILAYLDAEREQGRAMMPREPDNDMWNAGDNLRPTLGQLTRGIASLGDDVFYEVIPGPGKVWMAMFDAYRGEQKG